MRLLYGIAVLVILTACGGGSSPSGGTPTPSPTPTPQPANQSPVISALTVTPGNGIAQLTQFSMSGTATDPDGDSITYAWDLGDGRSAAGTATSATYSNPGDAVVKLTVTDSRGASASDSRTLKIGGMTGQWTGTVNLNVCIPGRIKPITANLTQTLTLVTGSVTLPEGLCSFRSGTAVTDPAEPGTIDANGRVQVRIKIPPFTDVYLRGNLDANGRRLTGGLFGSGHNGTPVEMERQ